MLRGLDINEEQGFVFGNECIENALAVPILYLVIVKHKVWDFQQQGMHPVLMDQHYVGKVCLY